MDRFSRLALVAVDRALGDAGLDPATWQGERVGLVLGTAFGCHATNEEYYRGFLAGGMGGASPRLFSYTLPSSPVGEISIHFGIRGPVEAFASGRQAGLQAIDRASRLCAQAADIVIAVAADVGGGTLPALGFDVHDRAAALVIESAAHAEARGAKARPMPKDPQLVGDDAVGPVAELIRRLG